MTDLLIRAAEHTDAEPIAALHVACWRDAFRGMVPDAVLDGPLLDERRPMWRQMLTVAPAGRLVLVATQDEPGGDTGAVVGFASGGRTRGRAAGVRFDAEIYTLYVALRLRGQRVGCRLMGAMATRLQLFGYGSVVLWTLRDNGPARAFYESLGGMVVGERKEQFAGAMLAEIGYGWPHIASLIEACGDRLTLVEEG